MRLIKWLMLGVVTLLPFLLAEIFVRLIFPHADLLVLTGHKIGENYIMQQWAHLDAFHAYRPQAIDFDGKTVNLDGFISTPEISVTKRSDTVRLLFLGGSSTAGTGSVALTDEITWPWLVVEKLRKRYPNQKFDFINGAVGGYTSFESYGRLWARLRFYKPDVIFVYHGWNEMYYFCVEPHHWRVHTDGSWGFHQTRLPVATYTPLWIDDLIWPSQFLTYIRLNVSEPFGGEFGHAPPCQFDETAFEIWREHLNLIETTSQLIGADLYVIKQASMVSGDVCDSCNYQLHGFGHKEHLQAYDGLYKIIDEEINPNRVIDATPLSGQSEYFFDHVHLTPVGTEALAQFVVEHFILE